MKSQNNEVALMRKKWFSLMSLMVLFVFGGAFAASATIIADLEVSDSFITAGESFEVVVSVSDDDSSGALAAFGFDVDPLGGLSLLSYDGYTIGDDFFDVSYPPSNVSGFSDPDVVNQADFVWLATLSFTALGAGTETILIEGLLNEFNGLTYLFSEADVFGSIDVTVNSAPVPEPASLVLVSFGIIGICALRRKN
jgi:hypothetical protein